MNLLYVSISLYDSTCNSDTIPHAKPLSRSGHGSVSLPAQNLLCSVWLLYLRHSLSGKTGPSLGLKHGVVCAQLGQMPSRWSSAAAVWLPKLCALGAKLVPFACRSAKAPLSLALQLALVLMLLVPSQSSILGHIKYC